MASARVYSSTRSRARINWNLVQIGNGHLTCFKILPISQRVQMPSLQWYYEQVPYEEGSDRCDLIIISEVFSPSAAYNEGVKKVLSFRCNNNIFSLFDSNNILSPTIIIFSLCVCQGDVLTRVDNVKVTSVKQAKRLMKKFKDGKTQNQDSCLHSHPSLLSVFFSPSSPSPSILITVKRPPAQFTSQLLKTVSCSPMGVRTNTPDGGVPQPGEEGGDLCYNNNTHIFTQQKLQCLPYLSHQLLQWTRPLIPCTTL